MGRRATKRRSTEDKLPAPYQKIATRARVQLSRIGKGKISKEGAELIGIIMEERYVTPEISIMAKEYESRGDIPLSERRRVADAVTTMLTIQSGLEVDAIIKAGIKDLNAKSIPIDEKIEFLQKRLEEEKRSQKKILLTLQSEALSKQDRMGLDILKKQSLKTITDEINRLEKEKRKLERPKKEKKIITPVEKQTMNIEKMINDIESRRKIFGEQHFNEERIKLIRNIAKNTEELSGADIDLMRERLAGIPEFFPHLVEDGRGTRGLSKKEKELLGLE